MYHEIHNLLSYNLGHWYGGNSNQQAVGGRPPRHAPAPLLLPWAPKRHAPPSRRQCSRSFSRSTWRWAKRPGDLDLWPIDLESGVRVTCDVDYLCANFGLPRPLCSRLRPDVRDRQTDVRQHHRFMPPPIRVGGIKSSVWVCALSVYSLTRWRFVLAATASAWHGTGKMNVCDDVGMSTRVVSHPASLTTW